MLGHLGINVPDLRRAKTYYDALMPLVGYEPFLSTEEEFAYLPAEGQRGAYLFYPTAAGSDTPYSRHATGLQHLAFVVRSRRAVLAVHQHVIDTAGEVLHPPQEFPQYMPPYFATFWSDPFGFMLEAVCHHDRD